MLGESTHVGEPIVPRSISLWLPHSSNPNRCTHHSTSRHWLSVHRMPKSSKKQKDKAADFSVGSRVFSS